ncbi:MAG: DUF1365 domain-containing protein [Phycisphaerales bacterium]
MSLHSAIYVGNVRHRRRSPAHAFTFPLFMVYLDLAEFERFFSLSRLWGTSRFCPARFRREDYLRHGSLDLDEAVRTLVHERLGRRPCGPIRVLTNLRYFGYIFNPVTFYYCFDDAGCLDAIVAEITNTPWNERHAYVLDAALARRSRPEGPLRWRFGKEFHVSPFLPMELHYDWTFSDPADSLLVHMNLHAADNVKPFDATLRLTRRELSPALLRGLLIRYPFQTARIITSIHLHALRLWLKRAPVFPHPRRRPLHASHGPAA